MLFFTGAVPEAGAGLKELWLEELLGRLDRVNIMGRQNRHKNGHQYKDAKNQGRCNGGLVLAEAANRILHKGGGLGVQLGIEDLRGGIYQLKIIGLEFNVTFLHYFFAPILIRGSIQP